MSLLAITVRWLLVGCCGLALLHFTGAEQTLTLRQWPRYYGQLIHRNAGILCISSQQTKRSTVSWYKAASPTAKKHLITPTEWIIFKHKNLTQNAFLSLIDLSIKDSGVYFCKINNVFGPGTEVEVGTRTDWESFLYWSQMKDGLMILQGLLLAGCIAAFVFRQKTLSERKECVYEEPEVDHIYEGLAIETCEGDLYEEIAVYAQAEGAEAPWE